jgi:hypothetical protein
MAPMSGISHAEAEALRLSAALAAVETALAAAAEPGAGFDALAEALAAPVRTFGVCARQMLTGEALREGAGE